LVIADAHLGLGQAVRAVFLGAGIQRCRVHFMRSRTAHHWDGGALSGACGGRAELSARVGKAATSRVVMLPATAPMSAALRIT